MSWTQTRRAVPGPTKQLHARWRGVLSQITQKYSGRRNAPQFPDGECPSSVATHLPVATSQTLSVLSPERQNTTRRPSGNTATLLTYDEARSSQKYSGRRNARNSECPFSVATHFAGRHVPHLERVVDDPDTTRRPSGETATQLTYDEATRSSQKYSGRHNAPSFEALPASPRTCRSPRPTP